VRFTTAFATEKLCASAIVLDEFWGVKPISGKVSHPVTMAADLRRLIILIYDMRFMRRFGIAGDSWRPCRMRPNPRSVALWDCGKFSCRYYLPVST
jgi:hypothetical protein